MADILSNLRAPEGANRGKTRVGRGLGSGLGKTCGRGQKGQKARATGRFSKRAFEGGQTTFQRRLPKRGFVNIFARVVEIVNVGELSERFESGMQVDEAALRRVKLVRGNCDRVKILGEGEIAIPLTVSAHMFSRAAVQKIEAAGGTVVVLGGEPSLGELKEDETGEASA